MDCNSIIYDAVHELERQKKDGKLDTTRDFEILIIEKVIENVDNYIRLINPTETAFIAFDGVAPFAKMNNSALADIKRCFYQRLILERINPDRGGIHPRLLQVPIL
jgi:hypothetical protein